MSASGLLIVIVINGSVRLSEQRRCGFVFSASAVRVWVSHATECYIALFCRSLKDVDSAFVKACKSFSALQKRDFNKVKKQKKQKKQELEQNK